MSLARVKNWVAEVLTYSDLNAEFNNILSNPGSLICPITFHLTFTDATYDIGASGATRPRDLFLSRNAVIGGTAYIGDTSNADVTLGLTINQGAADNQILALKSSDIAHGITDFAETDTYGAILKDSATDGGMMLRGFSESTIAVSLNANGVTDDTTKSSAGTGYVVVDAYKKNGTSRTGAGANSNVFVVQAGATTRFILDADGDSHQDVGTAWTNFDDMDDIATLDAVSYLVSRLDDPIKCKFGEWMNDKREVLEKTGLVKFNADGHHFMNMSKLAMLNTGAIRQLGERFTAIEQRMILLGAQ